MTIRTQLMLSHFRLLELLGQQENRQSKSVRESLRFFERAPTTSRVPSPIGEQPSGEPLKRKDRKPKPPCLSARALSFPQLISVRRVPSRFHASARAQKRCACGLSRLLLQLHDELAHVCPLFAPLSPHI